MKVAAPNLPLAPNEYDPRYVDRVLRDLTLFFNKLTQDGPLQGTTLTLTMLVGSTTLATTVNSTATSFVLTDATMFPTAGSGTIELEKFSWTGKTGNTLTGVTRGIVGTTAAAHTSGVITIASATTGAVYADPATRALYLNI